MKKVKKVKKVPGQKISSLRRDNCSLRGDVVSFPVVHDYLPR